LTWLPVALGGAAGSVLRYGVGRLAIAYLGPTTVLGTFIVNITGSFALGFLMALTFQRAPVPVELRSLITIGFLGGYTTFSTLSFESILLLEAGEVWKAGASLLGNLALGLAAAYLGMWLARAFY
jgi:fluoride exporter